jgi:hypothetical protein
MMQVVATVDLKSTSIRYIQPMSWQYTTSSCLSSIRRTCTVAQNTKHYVTVFMQVLIRNITLIMANRLARIVSRCAY